MTAVKTKYLDWYKEPVASFPKELKYNHAVDGHTVQFWKNLSTGVLDCFNEHKKLRPAHDIKPKIVTMWNMLKGGQDVVSRILKDVKLTSGRCLRGVFCLFVKF